MTGAFRVKGDDLDYWGAEDGEPGKGSQHPDSIGVSSGEHPEREKSTVWAPRKRPTDADLRGPKYENWLAYLRDAENYTTCDISQAKYHPKL